MPQGLLSLDHRTTRARNSSKDLPRTVISLLVKPHPIRRHLQHHSRLSVLSRGRDRTASMEDIKCHPHLGPIQATARLLNISSHRLCRFDINSSNSTESMIDECRKIWRGSGGNSRMQRIRGARTRTDKDGFLFITCKVIRFLNSVRLMCSCDVFYIDKRKF